MLSAIKDPRKVKAGQASARARWGEQPRVVRLDGLTTEQRRLVVALIAAAKSAPQEKTAGSGETFPAVVEGSRASDNAS